jgi:hypothetical protein
MLEKFLCGITTDSQGRSISDILEYDNSKLEIAHDYIQWIFPLCELSSFNPLAPILDQNEIQAIMANPKAVESLQLAVSRMIRFYTETSEWACNDNHNLLRITRIIKSTKILLGTDRSNAFLSTIIKRCRDLDFIPPIETMRFWTNACND